MANNVFQAKRTNVSGRLPNTTGSYVTNSQYIAAGEFALNMADGILFTSNGSAVIEVGANNRNARVTGNLVVNNTITTNTIYFANTGASAFTEGVVGWNFDEGTLNLGLSGNVSILQMGQEVLYRVKNQTGSTINNGTLVMANGTLGASGRIKVTPAIANGAYPSQYIMGLTTENIADGADGYVTHFGKVRGLNTSMWTEGSVLYADPANTGGMTSSKPTAPNNKTIVAIVISSHATEGTLFVRPTYGSSIADDEKVELGSMSNGDLLVWKSGNNRFENSNSVILSSITANGSVGTNGQVLSSNGSTIYWRDVTGTGATVTVSNSAPSSPANNDLWWDDSVGSMFVRYGDGDSAQWVESHPGGVLITDSSPPLYIQNTQPTVSPGNKYMWVQTGLGDGSDFSIWIEDGT